MVCRGVVGGSIAAGATYSCSFTGTISGLNAGAAHTNTITAQIRDNELNTASVSVSASVFISDVIPTISVTKTAG